MIVVVIDVAKIVYLFESCNRLSELYAHWQYLYHADRENKFRIILYFAHLIVPLHR